MLIHVLTLFPEMFASVLSATMLAKAQERGAIEIRLLNIRDFTTDKHRVTDDTPYGGGHGMVLKPEPVVAAFESLDREHSRPRRVLLTPQGRVFSQCDAVALAAVPEIALLCGRYEGIDDRVRAYVDDELSIGDFVLSGGEIAAMVVIDAVSRLLPGALGCAHSAEQESFADGLLEGPYFTRPPEFRGVQVPPVLLSGDHAAIARWRRQQALQRTLERRPDLLRRAPLTEEDRAFLAHLAEMSRG